MQCTTVCFIGLIRCRTVDQWLPRNIESIVKPRPRLYVSPSNVSNYSEMTTEIYLADIQTAHTVPTCVLPVVNYEEMVRYANS